MHTFVRIATVLSVVLVLSGLTPATRISATSAAGPPVSSPVRQDSESASPLRDGLAAQINQRRAEGLPAPDITSNRAFILSVPAVDFKLSTDPEALELSDGIQSLSAMDASETSVALTEVVTTTTLTFDSPQEGGVDQWPNIIVDESLDQGDQGNALDGDYTEQYKAAVEEQLPGYWDVYEYGSEPRIYTFTEVSTYSVPAASIEMLSAGAIAIPQTTETVLMGFTYTGKHLWYGFESKLCTPDFKVGKINFGSMCAYKFKIGFELDWAMGLRLPVDVTLTGPAEVSDGQTFQPSAVLKPLDWSAADYTEARIEPEDGNEYILRFIFFIGVDGSIGNVLPICPNCSLQANIDESKSFTTPFGAGSTFELGMIPIPIYSFPESDENKKDEEKDKKKTDPVFKAEIGVGVTPAVGSSSITADWRTLPGSDATGSGSITFTAPDTPVVLETVLAKDLDSADTADVELSNFRYWFTEFEVTISAYLRFKLLEFDEVTVPIDIFTLDLSHIMGDGVGCMAKHIQCEWNFVCKPVGPDNVLTVSSLIVPPPPPPPPPPPDPWCADFKGSMTEAIRVYIPPGTVTDGNVFFRRLVEDTKFIQHPGEVGKPEVLSRGVIQAVDVFALRHNGISTTAFNRPVTICLRGTGTLFYFDADGSPRAVSELPVCTQPGYTCGSIPHAGTVVLVNDSPAVSN